MVLEGGRCCGGGGGGSSGSSGSGGSGGAAHVELGAGCTIGQILQLPGLVLPGGLLVLKVFVRDSQAHRAFVRAEEQRLGVAAGRGLVVVGPSLDEIRKRLAQEQEQEQ
jgi:hypothetical protein